MTWAQLNVSPEETLRRQEACSRLNVLWHKRERTEDRNAIKRIDRKIEVIRRQEAPWLKDIAYWLY